MERIFELDTVKIFRILIVAQILLMVLTITTGTIGERSLPPLLKQYLEEQSREFESSLFKAFGFLMVGVGILAMYVLTTIGLLRWKRFGILFFLLSFLFYPVMLLLGIEIMTPMERVCDGLTVTTTGVLLGLCFHPDIKRRFGLASSGT